MKTNPSLWLAALLCTGIAFGNEAEQQPPIPVGIFLFESAYKVKRRNVSDLVAVNLSADPRFVLFERAELGKVLDEQAMGKAGFITSDTAARIGRLTGAKVLVTGRVFKSKPENEFVLTARIIGAETGRVYAQTVQGPVPNLVELTGALSEKIAQTISEQSTNLISKIPESREKRMEAILQTIAGKERPVVQLRIAEKVSAETQDISTVQTQLGILLQKAGFTVVDEKSSQPPDIVVTGEASATGGMIKGNLFSSRASVEIQAQQRTSGRIFSIDRQQSAGVDTAKETAMRVALENAADELAERLLPLLAQ